MITKFLYRLKVRIALIAIFFKKIAIERRIKFIERLCRDRFNYYDSIGDLRLMKDEVKSFMYKSPEGNPSGGCSWGIGFCITWQKGPLGSQNLPKKDRENNRNGAFVEDVLEAIIHRMEFYQDTKFNCEENRLALEHLNQALHNMQSRHKRRVKEGTEGTLKGT